MFPRQDATDSLLSHALAARRALVFLTVPWSCPERTARFAFRAAAAQLAAAHPALGIGVFSVDEEADPVQAWLGSLGIDGLGAGVARGAGSMLWLEAGRLVSSELGGADMSADGIVTRSLRLW